MGLIIKSAQPARQSNLRQVVRAALAGWDTGRVRRHLRLCAEHREFHQQAHPCLTLCAQPFDAALFALLHPLVQEEGLVERLSDCVARPELAQALGHCALSRVAACQLARGFIDDVILPSETRKRICRSLVMSQRQEAEKPVAQARQYSALKKTSVIFKK